MFLLQVECLMQFNFQNEATRTLFFLSSSLQFHLDPCPELGVQPPSPGLHLQQRLYRRRGRCDLGRRDRNGLKPVGLQQSGPEAAAPGRASNLLQMLQTENS